jgi:uncharacterized surface protein with fasciclin (FAS1) repeats
MKTVIAGLCLAAEAAAIVAPDPHVFAQLPLDVQRPTRWHIPNVPGFKKIADYVGNPFQHKTKSDNPLDQALATVDRNLLREASKPHPQSFEYLSWVEESKSKRGGLSHELFPHSSAHRQSRRGFLPQFPLKGAEHHPPRARHGCHQSAANLAPPPDHPKHPPHKRPGKRPHWRKGKHHHHIKSNLTIYELISKSNYTKHAAKIIDSDKDLVQLLNSTTANYTVFVPTDLAFKRRPKHAQNLDKKALKNLILYHISPGLYPTIRLVFGHTAPTLLEPKSLGGHPQRLLTRFFGFRRGLKVNYYSTVLAANIVRRNFFSSL